MKFLILILTFISFYSCTPKNTSSIPANAQAQGGVDVGNMTSAAVPQTNALMMYPKTWESEINATELVIKNESLSVIQANRAEISDLTSPNATALKKYLESKYPDRNYEPIEINGLSGVRADIIKTEEEKQSDIYLVSELKDFIHIQSHLKKADSGFENGENIISTVRIKYRGIPVENSQTTTVTLKSRETYSFLDECFIAKVRNCHGVGVYFNYSNGTDLLVGTAGYDHGRIVELGQISLDSILIDGEYLVAPQTKISIADIYTTFTPKDQKAELSRLNLKEGYVYLIRTVSWPEEDMIIKVKVESLTPNESVTLTYEKLIYVKPEALKEQVALINKNTLENEKPLNEGEVVLHNRAIWDNYYFASFNFEYSTSGNMYITRNSWDILFTKGCDGKPVLSVPHTGGEIGAIVDFGTRELSDLKKEDFPDPNLYTRGCGSSLEIGKTYGIYHHKYSDLNEAGAIYGAVKVLDMAKDQSWLRLKFRRIYLGSAEHFQKWINLSIANDIISKTLSITENYQARVFYPFIQKLGTEKTHYYENMTLNSSEDSDYHYLSVDSRPYQSDRGFINFGKNVDINTITLAEIESKKGHMTSFYENIQPGDVLGVYLENYYDKTVFVMKIESFIPTKSLTFTAKYLQRAKTNYSDDNE